MNTALNPEIQARREGTPRLISIISESMSQPQRIIPPVLPRKEQGKAGDSRKIIGPKLQPIPQPQHSHASSMTPNRPEPPLQPYHP